jgi:Phytanoyl-CoA dioxygenase (PhyH)
VITVEQRSELAGLGLTRLPGLVGGGEAARMADAIWAFLRERDGVRREDRGTWPRGPLAGFQRLVRRRVFAAFWTPELRAIVDELLGEGDWSEPFSWGPALVTFPEAGEWTVPDALWHFDLPACGRPDRLPAVRVIAFVTRVVAGGGGTVVVAGSHELVRRMVERVPSHDAGRSADVRRALVRDHPWFDALTRPGGDRIARFLRDGDEVDGARVRVVEITGEPGDAVLLHPWLLHARAPNCSSEPRMMVTNTIYRTVVPARPAAPAAVGPVR